MRVEINQVNPKAVEIKIRKVKSTIFSRRKTKSKRRILIRMRNKLLKAIEVIKM